MANSATTNDLQLQVANFNLSAMYGELERTRALLDVAVAANTINTELSATVRDAALQNLLTTLRPAMQVIRESE